MNGERLKKVFSFGSCAGVSGPLMLTLFPRAPLATGSSRRGGVDRRKSVLCTIDGSMVGSEMERLCIVGRHVPRSVRVSRDRCFSFS